MVSSFDELVKTADSLERYSEIYNSKRNERFRVATSFTGGEPTVNPEFFRFLEYLQEKYPHWKRTLTTNGFYSKRRLETVMKNTDFTTVSYHCEGTEAQKKQVQAWVNDKAIPHLLFSGAPGTGKTTLAKVLINDLNVEPADVLTINASRDNGVEMIRKKITAFSETMPWGDFKIILLDEADHISPEGQAALRGVMEQYASVVRFILTCNYPNMIIPAIHSRCQGFHITSQDQVDFTARVAEILITEGVEPSIDDLDLYVKATYPDLRKTINTVQMNVVDNVLRTLEQESSGGDWKINMVALFRENKIREARKLITQSARQMSTMTFLSFCIGLFVRIVIVVPMSTVNMTQHIF